MGISWHISATYRRLTSSKKDKEYGKPASAKKKNALITGHHYHSRALSAPSVCSIPVTISMSFSSGSRIKASKESISKMKSQSQTSGRLCKYFPRRLILHGKHQQISLRHMGPSQNVAKFHMYMYIHKKI